VIASDRAGAGPRVLLLHGLGGERHVWEPVWPALTARCDVLALDLPGFGGSTPLAAGEPADPVALAAVVAAFLAREGFEHPHVVGNSLGGWIALELARRGAARSVTALCPAGFWVRTPGSLPPGPRRAATALRPLIGAAFAVPALRRRALAGVMAHPERVPYRSAVRVARAYLGAPGYVRAQTAMRAGRLEDADGIDVPVTLAWGEHDRLVGPQRVPFTPTRSELLRDCGHIPTWDDPGRVAALILEDVAATADARVSSSRR
jgi:pimeloyl-ACP methyl ester carboxylesterase